MSASVTPKKQTTTTMEKVVQEKEKENQNDHPNKAESLVWDCGSSLYDSFELKSFERQLDSAISSRTLSMPHLSDHRQRTHPPPPPPPKKSSRFSRRLFQRILRSIFGQKQQKRSTRDGFYFLHGKGALSTIPEIPETDADYSGGGLLPDIDSTLRRSASDRFSAASIGISCA